MLGLLRRLYTTLIFLGSFIALGQAQSEAFIMGKIDAPTSRIVRFEFKRNHFSLEEGIFEIALDAENNFSIKVKITEPRAVNFTHYDRAVRLYVEPGDTLRMRFNGTKMIETLVFESTAALHNDYLLENQKAFPDWVNQNLTETARQDMTSRDYQAHIDEIFTQKRRFFDQYANELKVNFTNNFLEFTANDVNYWRAYELMLYVKMHGLNNPDPKRQIEDTYFNFLFETDNISQLALNNEYYLQYLDLYLGYMREKDGRGKAPSMEVVEEKSIFVQTLKPKGRNLVVLEEPYLTSSVVSWLNPTEEAVYQNLSTSEKFKYITADSSFEDYFYKIRTNDGKSGWVPVSLVTKHDKTVIERTVRARFCFEPNEPLCGFDNHLQGKVLYYMSAKDLLYCFIFEKPDIMELRTNRFVAQNTSYPEYNTVVKEAFKLTMQDRIRGLQRMNIPPSCEMENNTDDGASHALLLSAMPTKEFVTKELVEAKVELPASFPEDKPVPPKKIQTKDVKPIAEAKPQEEAEKPAPIVETKIEFKKTDEESKKPEITSVVPDSIQLLEQVIEAKLGTAPTQPAKPATPIRTETPAGPLVKSEEKTFKGPATAKAFVMGRDSMRLIIKDGKGEIDLTQETVLVPDLVEYDPTLKGVEFKGLFINDAVASFSFVDIQGKEISGEDLKNKIIVIDFWASYCIPCIEGIKQSQKLIEKYKGQDVVFLFVSIDYDKNMVNETLKGKNWQGIHGHDRVILPINFGVQRLPNYFVISKEGRVAYNSILKSRTNADKVIEALLKL